MNGPSRITRPLLYQEVISALYQIIDENQIEPGAQLPSERKLIEQLGVSRNVLREAFHVLELRGIITSRQGRGRFLRSLPHRPEPDGRMARALERCSLLEILEVRQTLEVKAMELVVRNAGQGDLEELEQGYAKMVERFRETGRTAGEYDLHRLYAKKTGNLFMEQILNHVLSAMLDMMHTTFSDILETHKTEQEARQHREILDAIQARDAQRAKQAMYLHIQETVNLIG